MSTEIIDVTLRDGGYVNNHCFTEVQGTKIISELQQSEIKFAEIGYYRPRDSADDNRNFNPAKCGIYYLDKIVNVVKTIKLVVMVHHNQVELSDYELLAKKGISLVRLVTKNEDIMKIKRHIKVIKSLGMSCSINLIRASEIPLRDILRCGDYAENQEADYFYIADSNGSLFPATVNSIVSELRSNLSLKLGFHAHDGLRLAFANSLVAISRGVNIIDSSLGGMGKGGGNLITELITTFLNSEERATYDIYRLTLITKDCLQEWIHINSIEQVKSIVASMLNLNIDDIKEIERKSEEKGISTLNLMCDLMQEKNLSCDFLGEGL